MAMRYAHLLLISAALLVPHCVSAQVFDLGIKGGVSRDDLTTTYQHEPLLGGNLGLFARVKAPIFPGIQGEVQLTSLGSNVTVEGYTAELRTLAVHTPLLAILAVGPVELHGGVYYEHYLTRRIATEFNIDIDGLPVEVGRLNDSGYGFLVGGGVRFGRFYAGARYNMGMEPMGSGPFLSDVYSRQVQGYIGVGFFKPFKKDSAEKKRD